MINNILNKGSGGNAIIKQWLLDIVEKKSLTRSSLILECLKNFKLTKEELKNKSSDSVLTKVKSRTGSVLSELINSEDLILEDKKIKLNKKSVQEIIKKDEIEQEIIVLMSDRKSYTRKQIYDMIAEKIHPNNQNNIRSLSGFALNHLIKAEKVIKKDNSYFLSKDDDFPNTKIGKCLKDAAKSSDIAPFFIRAFNIMGGEFFEEYTVTLMEKYLSNTDNGKVDQSKVTGGPNDDGIDGVIIYNDGLGFKEMVFVQAKIRSNNHVTLKEVREFFGALCGNKGTRGIFITNGSFHHEAQKFIDKQSNLVGIDGKKLFQLAKKLQYGIITKDNKDNLNRDLFIS
ncbi:MAG: restriction endonuclease [Bacilli bacterium]